MADKFATRDGNDIVIRVPLRRIEEIMADVGPGSMLDYPVTVSNVDDFLGQVVASINGTNAVEATLTTEVGSLLEMKSRSVKEHGKPRHLRAA